MPVKELLEKIEHGFHWMANGRERDQRHLPKGKRVRNYKWIAILALIALVVQGGILFLALFDTGLPYRVSRSSAERLDDPHFVRTLAALTNASVYEWSNFEDHAPRSVRSDRGDSVQIFPGGAS